METIAHGRRVSQGAWRELPVAAWLQRAPRDPSTPRPSAMAWTAELMRFAQDDKSLSSTFK
jgi:hypothetical protein